MYFSDFIMWHFPLSYKSFIGNNRLDDNQFERNLKKTCLHKTEFAQLPEPIKTEIEMSWYKIFDMEFTNKDYTNAMAEKKIQACCWEIRKEDYRNNRIYCKMKSWCLLKSHF
ncbi:MAG: DUF3841 domain-containing protein [Saprospiraceae bacterium]|nr:DUF3841 domain-containing protein [Saprospiraceae bacterium]